MSKHKIAGLLIFMAFTFHLNAQDRPLVTNYTHNPLTINPAIAGTVKGLNMNFLTRQQWVGIDGYPASYSFGAHTPYPEMDFGIGFNLMTERVGPVRNTEVKASYAYQIRVLNGAHLSMGLNAGITNFSASITGLELNDPNDHNFDENLNRTSPNFGVGGFLYTDEYYAGLSSPNLIHVRLQEEYRDSDEPYSPTVYLMGGYNYRIDHEWEFLPSALFSLQGGAPVMADITTQFLYQSKYYLGAHYRIGDAAGLFFNLKITEELSAGYAFDFTLNKLSNVNSGTHEFMIAYKLLNMW
jgi:type IX secretion system PorP/SprF family membrane protein